VSLLHPVRVADSAEQPRGPAQQDE
jgi:hypothetical protein